MPDSLDYMLIDLRDSKWTVKGARHEIKVKSALIDGFLTEDDTTSLLPQLKDWYARYADAGGSGDLVKDIDEIVMALSFSSIPAPRDSAGVALQIGLNQADNASFGSGSDFVIGGGGNDKLEGRDGADILLGGSGNDQLHGEDDNDYLLGGTGEDVLHGGDGRDRVEGGEGIDRGYGEDDDDLMIANLDAADDMLDGGSGTDTVVYKYDTGFGTISLRARQLQGGQGGEPNAQDFGIDIRGAQNARGQVTDFGHDRLHSIEKAAVEAGNLEDTLTLVKNGDGLTVDDIDYIDLGTQRAGRRDAISVVGWDKAIFADLSLDKFEWKTADERGREVGHILDVRNVEAVYGGSGNDILLGGVLTGVIPTYRGAGAITPEDGERLTVNGEGGRRSLLGQNYLLDGGRGNDTVVLAGGEGSYTAGGLGRDFIINRSKGGIIYGDTIGGIYTEIKRDAQGDPVLDENGAQIIEIKQVEDTAQNGDLIWWWPDTTLMDAGKYDQLRFFGMPLTGGGNVPTMALGGRFGGARGVAEGGLGYRLFQNALDPRTGKWDPTRNLYFDHFMPFMTYFLQRQSDGTTDLFIINQLTQLDGAELFAETPDDPATTEVDESQSIGGAMRIKDFRGHYSFSGSLQSLIQGNSDLGIGFKVANPLASILAMLPPMLITYVQGQGAALIDEATTLLNAGRRWAKALSWWTPGDPLVLDLDGDGIETSELGNRAPYFDMDGDKFAERTGWIAPDDGFLVLDLNGNGRIDDISEMFGDERQTGFAELALHDLNRDKLINAADAIWSELKVWRDFDQDGETDAGELSSLGGLGIVSIGVSATPLGATTPQGTNLLAYAGFTRSDGSRGSIFEAILPSDEIDTRYAGERGRAPWQQGVSLDARGFGTVTNLSVAMANDLELGSLVVSTAAAMTAPKLKTLIQQAGPVLGKWGASLELTRELVAVKLGTDPFGKTVLTDHAVYVEDNQGGYWTLKSGNDILDAAGVPVARATLAQVLAQGAGWQLEQAWSPSARAAAALSKRAAMLRFHPQKKYVTLPFRHRKYEKIYEIADWAHEGRSYVELPPSALVSTDPWRAASATVFD